MYLSEGEFHGGYGGGALLSDRWVLTAGRNLFLKKSREDTRGQQPLVPKVYLGVAKFEDAVGSKEAAVETVRSKPLWMHSRGVHGLSSTIDINRVCLAYIIYQSMFLEGNVTFYTCIGQTFTSSLLLLVSYY